MFAPCDAGVDEVVHDSGTGTGDPLTRAGLATGSAGNAAAGPVGARPEVELTGADPGETALGDVAAGPPAGTAADLDGSPLPRAVRDAGIVSWSGTKAAVPLAFAAVEGG